MTDRHPDPAITIRRLTTEDRDAVRRLAQLDSRRAPEDELLGAKIEGRLVAAISLATGEAIADPFSDTQGIQRILELRLRQLKPSPRERRAWVRLPGRATPNASW
jgi:hypothetical protein